LQPKKYLIQAIKKLISEKGIENIIVQDILDEANVSRATFYKYFWDKYDLANAYYSEYVKVNILPRYDGTNWFSLLVHLLTFIKENKDYFIQLTDLTIHSFTEFIAKFGEKGYSQNYLVNTGKKELSSEDRYMLEFYNAGCVRLICCWLKGGCTDEPDYIASLVLNLLPAVYHKVNNAAKAVSFDPYKIDMGK